jgi:predicted phosphodiesterase
VIQDTFEAWGVTQVHFAGDIVDSHAINFHEHDPDGYSPREEADKAEKAIEDWYSTFPKATVSIGNHDELHFRRARADGLPTRYLKNYAEVWKTPKWSWDFSFIFQKVLYTHGTGVSGKDAAINLATQKRISTVIGHTHSYAGVKYHANEYDRIFGLNVGCGIDRLAYAFHYGRDFPVKPILGCGIVVNGSRAFFEPMPCGPGEKYYRKRVRR